jgi:hypothetical protein
MVIEVTPIDSIINDILYGRRKEDKNKRYGITIAIHSGARTGKSLTAVALIVGLLLRWTEIKGVITNSRRLFLDKLPVKKEYKHLEDINIIKQEEFMGYLIYTDEFRRLCDARMSTTYKNLLISNLLADTGKLSQIHVLTDQDSMGVDKRVRVNVDIIMIPEMNLKTGICKVRYFESYWDYWNTYSHPLKLKLWDKYFMYEFEPYYKYYDTEEKIGEFYLKFEAEDYFKSFNEWIHETGYIKHPSFKIKNSTLDLWEESTNIYISQKQKRALMEWMLYNTEYSIKGRVVDK